MSLQKMLPIILINVLVSIFTTLVVLGIFYWLNTPDEAELQLDPGIVGNVNGIVGSGTVPANLAGGAGSVPVATAVPEFVEPEDETVYYIIRSGDTLGKIAVIYDVPVEHILIVNGIDNPNLLQVGQELIIPVNGLPTATPEPTSTPVPVTPTVIPSPIPTEPLELGESIIEIQEVVGVGVLSEEGILIKNVGTRAVSLEGWQLQESTGRVYTFGQVTLFENGGAMIHTEAGENGLSDLYWGLETAVWESGEMILLVNPDGVLQAQFKVD